MNEHFVINIGRQLGSGGRDIAAIIARRLGIKLYDKELINLAAEQSGLCAEFFEKADEKESRNVLSTMIGYLRSPFAGGCANVPNVLSNDALFKIQSDVIRDLAEHESCIFVGRCADYILREHPRRVDIFISADDSDRVRRICTRTGCTAEEARTRMERGDAQRADYYNYYSSKAWGAASTYHLCINSSIFGDEGTADFILEFASRKLDMKF
ncbi:AAA family ATPase [uncultured Alistipes sp.]|uniref:cytidylate kinase-like family protein n=1 Tax=uncultured Alistipes sp. TaxID=538949 RepID=UPI002617FF0A|nr:cytidylate kinase-like family protein [uncultured Alistipes sp.]